MTDAPDQEHEGEQTTPREGLFDAQLSFSAPHIEAPAQLTTIIKRDGREAPFDTDKIADAIFRAAQSSGGQDRDRANSLALAVTIYLGKTLDGRPPTVDQVHDAVEKVLIEMGHAKTALAYARYRDKRARIRKLRDGDVRGVLRELDEAWLAHANEASTRFGAITVRTSDEQLVDWDREKIVAALAQETGMDAGLAGVIALEVERQVMSANVQVLTTPLVRELVDAKLIEHGLEHFRHRHSRLGVPLYDADRIICAPNQGEIEGLLDPDATDAILADRIKREYALNQVYSREVAEAHLTGQLHLHDIGRIDRLHSLALSLDYVKRFGADGARAPISPEALLAHVGRFTDALRSLCTASLAWDAFNALLAPFIANLDVAAIGPLMRLLTVELAASSRKHLHSPPSVELGLTWSVPDWLASQEALGPGGVSTGKVYGEYLATTQHIAGAMLESLSEGAATDAAGRSFALGIVITQDLFAAPGAEGFLERAIDAALRGADVHFQFKRGESPAPGPARALRRGVLGQVTINLPRVAYRAADERGLARALREAVAAVARAHVEKHGFVQRLLGGGEIGPLAVLAAEREGHPLLSMGDVVCRIGFAGLNECVQRLTGRQLHESEEARGLAGSIMAQLKSLCDAAGESTGLHFVLAQTLEESIGHRFAALDLQHFPEVAREIVKTHSVTHDIGYTPGVRLAQAAGLSPMDQATLEGRFHVWMDEDTLTRVRLPDADASPASLIAFLRHVLKQTGCHRIALKS